MSAVLQPANCAGAEQDHDGDGGEQESRLASGAALAPFDVRSQSFLACDQSLLPIAKRTAQLLGVVAQIEHGVLEFGRVAEAVAQVAVGAQRGPVGDL